MLKLPSAFCSQPSKTGWRFWPLWYVCPAAADAAPSDERADETDDAPRGSSPAPHQSSFERLARSATLRSNSASDMWKKLIQAKLMSSIERLPKPTQFFGSGL